MLDLCDVLIADRSRVLRSLLSRLLKPHCSHTLTVEDCDSAISAIEQTPSLSLAIVESDLAGGGALRVLEHVSEQQGPRPAVILVAARPDPELEQRATLLGGVGVIEKPVTFKAIERALCSQRGPWPAASPRIYPRAPAAAILLGEDQKSRQLRLGVYDLSVTGALLATSGPLAVGERLPLLLVFEGQQLEVTARVVRVQQPSWNDMAGIGVEFEDVSASGRSRLEDFVTRMLSGEDGDDPL
jgi:CheY-like chemotaxis protein